MKQKRKDEKKGKGQFQKKTRKIVFLGGCEEKTLFFIKMAFLEKQGNTICVQKVQKTHIFVATICFWKVALLL